MAYRKILIILFLFSSTVAFSQPARNYSVKQDTLVSKKGDITKLTITRPNSIYQQVIQLKDGKKHGMQEIVDAQGTLIEQANYENGYLSGNQILYNPQSGVTEEKNYTYNKRANRSVLEGIFTTSRNKILYSKVTYKDSLKHGLYLEYFPDGAIRARGNFDQNLQSGKFEQFYVTGKPSVVQNFKIITDAKGVKKSVLDGREEKYKQDGKIYSEGSYQEGVKTGVWNTYYMNSDFIENQETYEKGRKHGPFIQYSETGKLRTRGIFYSEIEVNGKKLTNVYDGLIESYFQKTGKRASIENYTMGTKNGPEERYYDTGNLQSQAFYKNGLEDGEKKAFYPNGKLKFIFHVKNGVLEGESLEYYESGALQRKSVYVSKTINGNAKSDRAGWVYGYDLNGKPASQIFYDNKWERLVHTTEKEDKISKFELVGSLDIVYFPDGQLMSFSIRNRSYPIFSTYYYKNQGLRKMTFQDPKSFELQEADFSDQGKLLNVYPVNQSSANPGNTLHAAELAKYVNPDWIKSPLFADIGKKGTYQLKYNNQKPFLNIEFKDNLPHGNFLVLDPLNGDTLVYKKFENGVQKGYFVEKFAGKKLVKKGIYYDNGQLATQESFRRGGIPDLKYSYDLTGKSTSYSNYYEDGKLKSTTNELDQTSATYDSKGLINLEQVKVAGRIGWTVQRSYYAGSRQLRYEQYYFGGKQDSLLKYYHENGQIYYQTAFKQGQKDGQHTEYDKDGILKRKGQYKKNEMFGEWFVFNGPKKESLVYQNGKLVVKAPTIACGCIDTTFSNNKIQWAPSLESLTSLKNVKKHVPPFLKLLNEEDYGSIFYINYNSAVGHGNTSVQLDLLMHKDVSFLIPADQQIKISLNPCRTEGYISKMQTYVNYDQKNDKEIRASLYPKRISIDLLNSPLKSADKQYKNFTALLDVESIDWLQSRFEVNSAKEPKACFTKGIIKEFLNVEVINAEPSLFNSEIPFHMSGIVRQGELDNFFGLWIKDANVSFNVSENNKNQHFSVKGSELLAGGKFVSGSLSIPCKKTAADSFLVTNNDDPFTFSSQNLKKEWAKQGFTRLSTVYNQENEALVVSFFAE